MYEHEEVWTRVMLKYISNLNSILFEYTIRHIEILNNSRHMTFDKTAFTSYSEQFNFCVEVGNGERTKIVCIGTVNLILAIYGRSKPFTIQNVLHVPDLGYQLLSVSQLNKSEIQTLFSSAGAQLIRDQELIAAGSLVVNLYKVNVTHGHNST